MYFYSNTRVKINITEKKTFTFFHLTSPLDLENRRFSMVFENFIYKKVLMG